MDGGAVSFFTPVAKFKASLYVLIVAFCLLSSSHYCKKLFPCGLWVVYTESDKGRRRSRRPPPAAYAYFYAVALRRGCRVSTARPNFPSLFKFTPQTHSHHHSLTFLSSHKLTHFPIQTKPSKLPRHFQQPETSWRPSRDSRATSGTRFFCYLRPFSYIWDP